MESLMGEKKEKSRFRRRKTSVAYKIGQSLNYLVLLLLGFVTLYPFYYCVILAFNDGQDALKGGIYFFPRVFSIDNFVKAFQHPLIGSSFSISISRTILVVLISCFLTALMAYALAQKNLPGKRFLVFYFYLTTIFPAGLIPNYIAYRQLGLINNYWILVLPSLFSFFNAVILRTFFTTIPESLPESARIDGCSEFAIFFRIMLPLSIPAIATIALFVGVGVWNDWFTGAYFLTRRRDLYPAATLLNDLLSQAVFETTTDSVSGQSRINESMMMSAVQSTTPESLKMAFLVILTTPIILVYPFLQKYFVSGMMVGSIKE